MVSDILKNFRALVLDPGPSPRSLEPMLVPLIRHLNVYFYDTKSGTDHGTIFGSYLRQTAIPEYSSIDVLYSLPNDFRRFVERSNTDFEVRILDLFRQIMGATEWQFNVDELGRTITVVDSATYPVTLWPVIEIGSGEYRRFQFNDTKTQAIFRPFALDSGFLIQNENSDQNLRILCRSVRHWAKRNAVPIGGFLIDCLATQFITTSPYRKFSNTYQDRLLRDFFLWLSQMEPHQTFWEIYGTKDLVFRTGLFEMHAEDAYHAVERLISNSLIRQDDEVRNVMRDLIGVEPAFF